MKKCFPHSQKTISIKSFGVKRIKKTLLKLIVKVFSALNHLSLNSSKGSVLLFSLKHQPDRKKKNRQNQGMGAGKLIPADTNGAHVNCIETDLLFCMAGSLKKLPQISTPSRPMSDTLPVHIPPVLYSRL